MVLFTDMGKLREGQVHRAGAEPRVSCGHVESDVDY